MVTAICGRITAIPNEPPYLGSRRGWIHDILGLISKNILPNLFREVIKNSMSNSFFASDLFRFGSTLLGIIISSWVIIARLKERTPGKVLEVITMVTFGIGGFSSIVSFFMHFFF